MTAQNPAIFLQAGSHPAEDVRRFIAALSADTNGVVAAGDLAVTQNGTPNMSVNVAGGRAFIKGSEATYQGSYFVENRGAANLPVAAADPTNRRYDLIVARVKDAAYSGASSAWTLEVVTGVAAPSPAEPAVPANSLVLARVQVDAGATSITNAAITDRRTTTPGQTLASALGGTIICTSATRPASPFAGLSIFETDTGTQRTHSGTAWVPTGGVTPGARVFNSAAISVPNGTVTALTFNSERFDTDNIHSTASNTGRLTAQTAGVYVITGHVRWTINASGLRYLSIRLGGTSELATVRQQAMSDVTEQTVATIAKLAAGDYVELTGFQSSGGALNVEVFDRNSPEFAMQFLSAV